MFIMERDDRNALMDDDAMLLNRRDLERIIRDETHGSYPESIENLFHDGVFPIVCRKPELFIGIDRIESRILECVGTDLVQKPDTPPLLSEVDEDSSHLCNHLQCGIQLLSAITLERMKDITGDAG